MDNIINKVITVSSIEDKERTLKIKDQDGRTYNIFKTKQDGQPTVAYSILFGLPGFGMGKTLEASYKESPYTTPDGNQVTTRSIIAFKSTQAPRPDMTPVTPNVAPKPSYGANIDKKAPSNDPDWDEIARGKVRHGVAIAFIEKNSQLTEETAKEINRWTNYIMTGSILTTKTPITPGYAKDNRGNITVDDFPLPEETIDVSQIPF